MIKRTYQLEPEWVWAGLNRSEHVYPGPDQLWIGSEPAWSTPEWFCLNRLNWRRTALSGSKWVWCFCCIRSEWVWTGSEQVWTLIWIHFFKSFPVSLQCRYFCKVKANQQLLLVLMALAWWIIEWLVDGDWDWLSGIYLYIGIWLNQFRIFAFWCVLLMHPSCVKPGDSGVFSPRLSELMSGMFWKILCVIVLCWVWLRRRFDLWASEASLTVNPTSSSLVAPPFDFHHGVKSFRFLVSFALLVTKEKKKQIKERKKERSTKSEVVKSFFCFLLTQQEQPNPQIALFLCCLSSSDSEKCCTVQSSLAFLASC